MEKGMTLRDGKQIRAEGESDEEERRHGMGDFQVHYMEQDHNEETERTETEEMIENQTAENSQKKKERMDIMNIKEIIRDHLENHALIWFSAREKDMSEFQDFETAFLQYFWGENTQSTIREQLYFGKFDENRSHSLNNYAIQLHAMTQYLEPPIPEEEIVMFIARHFKAELAETIAIQNIRKLDQLSINYNTNTNNRNNNDSYRQNNYNDRNNRQYRGLERRNSEGNMQRGNGDQETRRVNFQRINQDRRNRSESRDDDVTNINETRLHTAQIYRENTRQTTEQINDNENF
ncbi:probable serine/threonine-protein kinase DDB_G0291350 [Diorhabda carinulata]|uniref:probable serine/threonine-protein kinase DDB_G0291350 n=1 Tax=Diorhabda carinulata TaxID=1163345 RepID=UPI0025A20081|nr:probable serine/threonine-protein kinase DDB_G0291350 [Diorhabda carinulata]